MGSFRPVHNYRVEESEPPLTIAVRGTTIQTTQWEYELLQHNQDIEPRLPNFHDAVRNNVVITCSDGSATERGGSFGFVVSTVQGRRIAHGNGPAPGAYSNSFRSEAFGVLAAIRWLFHALKNFQSRHRNKVIHYLDNQSVITRLNTIQNMQAYPNTTLFPEQDVITEIIHTIRLLPVTVEFKWVKGHQDTSKPYHRLEIPAQLNCDADRKASEYECTNEHLPRRITPLPHTPCQFIIDGKSITGHYKRRIREATYGPRLKDYLCKKFQWEEHTYQCIDHRTYQHIIQRFHEQRTTITKHVHDISPTGKIAHRNNCHLPHECPACNSPEEDNLHVIQCSHPSRLEWRLTTLQKLSHYAVNKSDPTLIIILQDGLNQLHQNADPNLPTAQYPPKYQPLIEQQNAIGWDQIYKGRWSVAWAMLQEQYVNSTGNNEDSTATRWLIGLGRLMMEQWLQLWKIRNNQRHSKDTELHAQQRSERILSELKEIYKYKDRVCPEESRLFQASADEHFQTHLLRSRDD